MQTAGGYVLRETYKAVAEYRHKLPVDPRLKLDDFMNAGIIDLIGTGDGMLSSSFGFGVVEVRRIVLSSFVIVCICTSAVASTVLFISLVSFIKSFSKVS